MQSIVILDMLRYECEMKIGNVLVVVCRLHYMTSTNAGFCQGNMTWCHAARGQDYHWVIDLYERMNLPVISAVVRALHSSTQDRIDALRKQKTDESKHKRIRVKVARAEDQEARKKWVKRQALVHTYGGGDDDDGNDDVSEEITREANVLMGGTVEEDGGLTVISGKKCKCGSTQHKRTSHKDSNEQVKEMFLLCIIVMKVIQVQ